MSRVESVTLVVPAAVAAGAAQSVVGMANVAVQVDFGDLVGTCFVQFSLVGSSGPWIDATTVGLTASGAVHLGGMRVKAVRTRLSAYTSGTTQTATATGDDA